MAVQKYKYPGACVSINKRKEDLTRHAYKFLLNLSVTLVTCERSFSISVLKIIKSRIRSLLTQDHLEAFMLMKCEYETVHNIDNNEIIEKVAEHSDVYWRNLKY